MVFASPPRYLMDTPIVLAYARANELGRWIEATYQLLSNPETPLISAVTIGEMLSLARQFDWGETRTQRLRELLLRFIAVPLEYAGLFDAYAELDDWSHRRGRAIGKNDLWIAATAHVTGALLLTTDLDFDALHPDHLMREWIDPASRLVE
jgi:tRNA(fMet)-specific endonuclease VapC